MLQRDIFTYELVLIALECSHILHMFDSGKHYKTWLHRNYNRSIFLTQPPRTWAVTRIFLIVVAHKYELLICTPLSFGTKKRLLQKSLISISWLNTLLFFFGWLMVEQNYTLGVSLKKLYWIIDMLKNSSNFS
jgi:hypothetical protein